MRHAGPCIIIITIMRAPTRIATCGRAARQVNRARCVVYIRSLICVAFNKAGESSSLTAEPLDTADDSSSSSGKGLIADYMYALHRVVFDPITDVVRLISGCSKVLGDPAMPMKGTISESACSFCSGDTLSRVVKDIVLIVAFLLYVISLVWLLAIYLGVEGSDTKCKVNMLIWSSMPLFDYLRLRMTLAFLVCVPVLYLVCMVGFRQQQLANGMPDGLWRKPYFTVLVTLLMIGSLMCIAIDCSVAQNLASNWSASDVCYITEQTMGKHAVGLRVGLNMMPITQAVLTCPLFLWSVFFLMHEAFLNHA